MTKLIVAFVTSAYERTPLRAANKFIAKRSLWNLPLPKLQALCQQIYQILQFFWSF